MTLYDAFSLELNGIIVLVGAGGKTSAMFRLAHELSNRGETVLTTTTTKIYPPTASQSSCCILSDSIDQILSMSKQLLKQSYHVTAALKQGADGKLIGFPPTAIDELFGADMFNWILVEGDGASGMPLKAPADHEPVIPLSAQRVIGFAGLDAVNKPIRNPYVFRPELVTRIAGFSEGIVSEETVCAVLMHENGVLKGSPSHAVQMVFLNKVNSSEALASARTIATIIQQNNTRKIRRCIIGDTFKECAVIEVFSF